MKFKLLTIILLTHSYYELLNIKLDWLTIPEDHRIGVFLTEYSLDDKYPTDVKKRYLSCAFDHRLFCKNKIKIHYFEIFQQKQNLVSQIKSDITTYATIRITCQGFVHNNFDTDVIKKKYIQYATYKPSTVIKYFEQPEIVGCHVTNMGVLDKDGHIMYHHLVLNMLNGKHMKKVKKAEVNNAKENENLKEGFKIVYNDFEAINENRFKKKREKYENKSGDNLIERVFIGFLILLALI